MLLHNGTPIKRPLCCVHCLLLLFPWAGVGDWALTWVPLNDRTLWTVEPAPFLLRCSGGKTFGFSALWLTKPSVLFKPSIFRCVETNQVYFGILVSESLCNLTGVWSLLVFYFDTITLIIFFSFCRFLLFISFFFLARKALLAHYMGYCFFHFVYFYIL